MNQPLRTVTLTRFAHTPYGTFGYLRTHEFQCFTVECPWLGNEPWVSCIPTGDYDLVLGRFHRGGYGTYELLDVPNRTHIKFHVGNTMDDLRGCIAPGKGLGLVKAKWAVTSSAPAFKLFMGTMLGIKEALLQVRFLDVANLYSQRKDA